jgi:hypothetical protein
MSTPSIPTPSDDPASRPQRESKAIGTVLTWSLGVVLGALVLTGTYVGLSAAMQVYRRAEQRANAENGVRLAHIAIRRAEQQGLVARADLAKAKADAQEQYQKAIGVRLTQETIGRGLTRQFLQYEAIQAQKAVATSGRNNTLVYLPSGSGGVPLVQDPQTLNRLKP